MDGNDLLSQTEIAAITGVPEGAHSKVQRRIEVLDRAGIYYWMADDGSILTTWTHVHRAGKETQNKPKAMPDFRKVS